MMSKALLFGLLLTGATDAGPSAAPAIHSELSVRVDLSRRVLEVRVDGKLRGRYLVAVGKEGYRTPAGSYRLSQVVWNPKWVPPDGAWAQDKEPKGPGEAGNPMGRVKIMFDRELYIHGTPATGTLGEPASHGCIRMRNRDAQRLARLVMEYGGAHKPTTWYSRVSRNPSQAFEVAIPNPGRLAIVE